MAASAVTWMPRCAKIGPVWCAAQVALSQIRVCGCRTMALNEDLRVDLILESITRESDAVNADREIGDLERPMRFGRHSLFQAGGEIVDLGGRNLR